MIEYADSLNLQTIAGGRDTAAAGLTNPDGGGIEIDLLRVKTMAPIMTGGPQMRSVVVMVNSMISAEDENADSTHLQKI